MDYEKNYKDALTHAREIHRNEEEKRKDMEFLFPELRESEDERIRKEIISALKWANHRGIYDKHIAWLEEQKTSEEALQYLKENHSPSEVSDFQAAMNIAVAKAYDKGIKDGLEKQGEKLVKDIESDKAEKFKVGDWIVNKGHSYLIADIDYEQRRYLFEIGGYTHEQLNWEYIENADNKYHLWTLADAKDGDVLAFDNDTIVIFKDLYNATTFHSYCHIEDGVFDISEDDMPDWWEGKGFKPATKEQHAQLFQKMKEAGYEWDAEKKKLGKRVIDEGKAEMDYCFTKMMNGEKVSSAWSEDDENILEAITYTVKNSGYSHCIGVSIKVMIEWLKSLKDRVQPKSQWKPSEDQIKVCKEVYAGLLSAKGCNVGTVNSEINRLEEQLKKL